MKSCLLIVFLTVCASSFSIAQEDQPTDYPARQFHEGRRDSLRKLMPENSVFVVFAYPERNYSNDVNYNYHANPDLYYFTGYREPNAVLFIFKEPQQFRGNASSATLFFVQQRNALAEQWTGRRLGKDGVKEMTGLAEVYDGSAFARFPLDLSRFDSIIVAGLPQGMTDDPNDTADISDLANQFKEKTGILRNPGNARKFAVESYSALTGKLREIKTEQEMDLLRKAIEISCIGQLEVMKAVRPDMSETEIQGLHEYVHKKYGAESIGYPSIIGAGNNGCVLHYTENNRTKVGNRLILMDVGAEYRGYTADVTRTIPANGKFSEAQRIIYNLVYESQEAVFKLCKEGSSWEALNRTSKEVIAAGLIKLGIIRKKEEVSRYYPHGLGHHIGLDVHDISVSSDIRKGMVITVEPGIYIPENSPCDKKWWGIAVRIEDDVLIREKDYELLSSSAPRTADAVEKMIAEKSALDDFSLPRLKSAKKAF